MAVNTHFLSLLGMVLKYASPSIEAKRKALLNKTLQNPVYQANTPKEIADSLIQRWSNFKSTPEAPEPSHHIHLSPASPDEHTHWSALLDRHNPAGFVSTAHLGDFHDLAAVLAGRKPAALVGSDFLLKHPVGREMLGRASSMGYGNLPIKSSTGDTYAIGRHETLANLKASLASGDIEGTKRWLGYTTTDAGAKNNNTPQFTTSNKSLNRFNKAVNKFGY